MSILRLFMSLECISSTQQSLLLLFIIITKSASVSMSMAMPTYNLKLQATLISGIYFHTTQAQRS